MSEIKWLPVIVLANLEDLGQKIKDFQKGDVLDVKTATKRGGSWQIGFPKELASAIGLKDEKEKVVFLRTKIHDKAVFFIVKAQALIPF